MNITTKYSLGDKVVVDSFESKVMEVISMKLVVNSLGITTMYAVEGESGVRYWHDEKELHLVVVR